jgi:hypothetical protein
MDEANILTIFATGTPSGWLTVIAAIVKISPGQFF